jgi:DNA mismatch repair protein MLH3
MGQGAGSWVSKIRTCPQGIIDMLNSRACRSAIMFNDELSKEQCEAIVCRLADCAFPFQCAHGRPSLVPLVDLGSLGLFGAQEIGNVSGSF